MRANLYVVNPSGQTTITDGNYTEYADSYSNEVDMNDIIKMVNPEINFGILRSSKTLVIEKRNIPNSSDTTFFRMWNMPRKNYMLKLILDGLDNTDRLAFVKDEYMSTLIPILLTGTTDINFTVDTSSLSASEDRFKLIFQSRPAVVNPDTLIVAGIDIFPNPVVNKTMQIRFGKQVPGKYYLTLIYFNGRQQQLETLEVINPQSNFMVKMPQSIASGIYSLKVSGPQNLTLVKTILIVNK